MKITFANPCPSSNIDFSLTNSKLKFDVNPGEGIICPYDGVITKYKNNDLSITHEIDGNNWESKITEIQPIVGLGKRVKKNDLIGHSTGDRVTYQVILSDGKKIKSLEELITTGIDSNKVNINKSKEEEYKPNVGDENLALQGLGKILLSPLSFVQGALNLNKEEIEERNKLIKEDIDRIKKLF